MASNRWTTRGAALAVATATAALMLATEPRLAIVWDEGYTLGREARLRLWFRALRDPAGFAAEFRPPTDELVQTTGRTPPTPPPLPSQIGTRASLLLDPGVLAWFWPFAREEPHGHPPFYALLGLVGDVLTPGRPVLARARLGPILAFSAAAGALFGFMARRWGWWPAALAAGAWVFQPNLFGHGHYASYDGPLSSLWLLAVLAFGLAVEPEAAPGPEPGTRTRPSPRWGWVVVFGLLLGCAAGTKLTGWFLPVPFVAWSLIDRSRPGALTLLAGGAVGLLTVLVINPAWWTEPIAGSARFFASNLGRARSIPIKVLFLGRVVSTPDGSLPWYNTLVWTVFVTPVGFLGLALAGAGRALRRWRTEPFGLLALGHWSFFLVLRALPHTPGHDGVRQFLAGFGPLAVVAGLGAASAVGRLGRWGKVLVAAALAEGVVSVTLMMPVPLSYYSPLVGGLPGARALGMEPTYYWDALTDDAIDWLRANTPPGLKVRFSTYPSSLLYLRDTGRLPEGWLRQANDRHGWAWYVLQNRPGSFRPMDRALAERGRPAYVVRKWGVPLIWVFPYDEIEAVTRPTPSPSPAAWETPGPAGSRGSRGAAGRGESALRRGRARLHALAGGLGRGLGGRIDRGRGVGRGVGGGVRRGGANRGRRTGLLLVAEAAEPLVAAVLGRGGLADRRGRGRGGLADRRGGAGRGAGGLLLVTTCLGVARRQSAENANEGQGQQVPSHRSVSNLFSKCKIWVVRRVWAICVPCSKTKGNRKSGLCNHFFAIRRLGG